MHGCLSDAVKPNTVGSALLLHVLQHSEHVHRQDSIAERGRSIELGNSAVLDSICRIKQLPSDSGAWAVYEWLECHSALHRAGSSRSAIEATCLVSSLDGRWYSGPKATNGDHRSLTAAGRAINWTRITAGNCCEERRHRQRPAHTVERPVFCHVPGAEHIQRR